METSGKQPEGIGGWLILVIIGLVLTPIRVAILLVGTHLPIFSDGTWQVLTSPDSEVYHRLWAPLMVFEIVGNVMLILCAIAALVFILRKSRHAPKVAMAYLLGSMLFVMADYLLAQQIPVIAEMPIDPDTAKEMARSLVACLVWVPYFCVSRRVKATFIR